MFRPSFFGSLSAAVFLALCVAGCEAEPQGLSAEDDALDTGFAPLGLEEDATAIDAAAFASGSLVWSFDTDGDREGWTTEHIGNGGAGPVDGLWIFAPDQADPQLLSPQISIDAVQFPSLSIRLANDRGPAAAARMQVFWSVDGAGFSEQNSMVVDISNGGGWSDYSLALSSHPGWRGQITQLRIDPVLYGDGHSVGINSIVLGAVGGAPPVVAPPAPAPTSPPPAPAPSNSALSWGFDADGDRLGWSVESMVELSGGPSGGLWIFSADQADPKLTSPSLSFAAADYPTLNVRMANDHGPVAASQMQIFWNANGAGFSEANSVVVDISNGGGWVDYAVGLSSHPGWQGQISQLRIDPVRYGDGHSVGIDSIALSATGAPPVAPPPQGPVTPPVTPPVSPSSSSSVLLTPTHFHADGASARGVNVWGTASYPGGMPDNARSTVFWGRFQNNACGTPGYGSTAVHPLAVPGVQVFRAYYPDCGGSYGPSVDADVFAFGAAQHLLRTEVRPGGAFQSFGPSGQNASGANAYIQAAYTQFSPAWRASNPSRVRPWSGPSTDPALIRFALQARQSVTRDLLERPSSQQLQQVIRMLVINENCDIATSRSFCQIEFNFKTYNRGMGAYTSFGSGDVFNDGGQGGLIAVVGPIGSAGQSTQILGNSAWTSWGASTQLGPFQDETFQVEMSWTQFQQLLLSVTGNNPAPVFGPRWQDRSSWVLLAMGYGQENYNPTSNQASLVEGLFESTDLFAL